MEKIEFNFPDTMEEVDRANAILQFLVNRASIFSSEKFKYIIMDDAKDTSKYHLAYHILSIMAIMTHTPMYITRKIKKMSWFDDAPYLVKVASFWKLLWLRIKGRGLYFSFRTFDEPYEVTKRPQLFFGVTNENIDYIVTQLLSYQESYGN